MSFGINFLFGLEIKINIIFPTKINQNFAFLELKIVFIVGCSFFHYYLLHQMTKEDKDLESVVTENDTEVTAENDDLDITKPKIIKYFTTVFIIFVLFTLYCTPQVALIWFGYNFSSDIEGTVVSPFMSVVDEYAPQSTQPCVYPTLDYPYENTFSCNCKYFKTNLLDFIFTLLS